MPPAGVWRTALETRLLTVCRSRTGSASRSGGRGVPGGGVRTVRVTPAVSAGPWCAAATWPSSSSIRTGFAVQAQGARVGRAQVLEVVDDVLELHRLLQERGDERRVRFGQSVLGRLQPAPDVAQRRPQLMGDVADHHLALLLQPGPVRGHVVEGRRQPSDLVVRDDRHGHRRRVQAVPHALGGAGERVQRAYEPGSGEHRGADGEGEDQGGDPGDACGVGRERSKPGTPAAPGPSMNSSAGAAT